MMLDQYGNNDFSPVQIASVLGHYDVLDLIAGRPGDVDGMLGDLATVSDESVLEERYGWIMKTRERVSVLSSMDEATIARLLARTQTHVFADDGYACALRVALSGELPSAEANGAEALAALKLAALLPAFDARRDVLETEIARIENSLQVDREKASLEFVISNRQPLVGRNQELKKLVSFATGVDGSETIVLSGDAGVGKSALLATLIRTLNESGEAITVVLDFDGPQLASAEPAEFLREFSRRLASAAAATNILTPAEKAELTARMKALRGRIRSRASEKGSVRRISSEEQYRSVEAYAAEAFETLPQALKAKPILLVLDTFEVALAAGEVEIDRLLTMVMQLRERFNLPSLRAIVAGRSLAGQLGSWSRLARDVLAPTDRWLLLSALKPRAAERLIANLDTDVGRFEDPALRRKAAKIAGYYPLSLKLVYRATRDLWGEELSSYLDGLRGGDNFADEISTQFLHSRILGRIDDPSLRKLAAPGLLLRIVSPDLIRLVLAKPCGLDDVTPARATDLYEKLKKTWLVDEPGDTFARHRNDLRRQMVAAITADDPQKAYALHRAAAGFYRDGPFESDPAMAFWKSLNPEVRHAEAVYHSALAGDRYPGAMSRSDARSLRKNLGLDIDLLPDGWIAVIRAATGDISTLTSEQVKTLSGALREEAIAKEIDRLLAVNDSEAAARLVLTRSEGEADSIRSSPAKDARNRPGDLSSRELQQDILVAWANAGIEKAAMAFEKLVGLEPDRLTGLMATLPDAVLKDSSGLAAGVLAASLKRPWSIPPGDTVLSQPPAPQMAEAYFAALLLLADKSSFKTIIEELRSSSFVRRALGGREATYVSYRLRAWTVAITAAMGEGLYETVRIPKPFLDLEAIIRLATPDANVTGSSSLSAYETVQALHVLRQGPTNARIENVYRTDDLLELSVGDFIGNRAGLRELLRGLTPELHQPTAFLLRRAPSEQLIGFLREQMVTNPLWPRDQSYEKARWKRQFPEQQTLSVVVTCDRLRMLPSLLEWLAQYQEEASDLLSIHRHITARLFFDFNLNPDGSAA